LQRIASIASEETHDAKAEIALHRALTNSLSCPVAHKSQNFDYLMSVEILDRLAQMFLRIFPVNLRQFPKKRRRKKSFFAQDFSAG
jgi:hypothetical protein